MALYKTIIVRPLLEYGCAIWDPVSPSTSYILGVQFFTLKLFSKTWNSSYSSLLSLLKIDPLYQQRKRIKLILFFKIIIKNMCHVPSSPLEKLTYIRTIRFMYILKYGTLYLTVLNHLSLSLLKSCLGGRSPKAYGSHLVCVCVCVCVCVLSLCVCVCVCVCVSHSAR